MKVWEIQGSFGLDNLRAAERPEPEPGPGELLLAVRAVSLNHRDLTTVLGVYNPKHPLPLIPCSDAAAEVLAVGEGVDRFAPGDRVCPLFAPRWLAGEPERERLRSTLGGPLDGTLAERIVVPAEAAVAIPAHLSDEEAATLPCAALTAWSAVVTLGRTTPGDVVVVLGTGGVSLFALQFARLAGAEVIVTSSSPAKLERARELGAVAGIDYRAEPDWARRVKELTGGRGADLVVEVGGAGTLAQSLHAVRMGGTVAMIGALSGPTAPLSVIPILMRQVRVQGVLVGHREGFEAMNRALAAHRLRPVIDRVFPFEETPAAFRHLATGAHFGKVVVRVGIE
jgi:NADPH:quinone reductase-like Zn-dependent oxidoreductase